MMGVEIREEALMISFRRGTPKMTFTDATPTGMYVCHGYHNYYYYHNHHHHYSYY
jgi:uncharacterized protein YodC (DUF2158 family)